MDHVLKKYCTISSAHHGVELRFCSARDSYCLHIEHVGRIRPEVLCLYPICVFIVMAKEREVAFFRPFSYFVIHRGE